MDAVRILNKEQRKFSSTLMSIIDSLGYFPFPSDLTRFSPINYHGKPYDYSNRVQLYYESLVRGYTSRVYLDKTDLISLGIRKDRKWIESNRITIPKYVYKTKKVYVGEDEDERDSSDFITYRTFVRKGFENVYNNSVIPEIEEQEVDPEVVVDDPISVLNQVQTIESVFYQNVVESDSFYYDRDSELINVRLINEDESVYDYLFEYVRALMESTGKLYRHGHQARDYVKRIPDDIERSRRISFEESMVVTFATIMFLATNGVDISKVSEKYLKLEDPDDLDYLKSLLKKNGSYIFHYTNDAWKAVMVLSKYSTKS